MNINDSGQRRMRAVEIFAGRGGLLCWLWMMAASAMAFDHSHGPWTELLKAHVRVLDGGQASQVDYAGFTRSQAQLEGYLRALSAVEEREFKGFSVNQQKAFLINAYNAFTIELILGAYPDLDSIRDLGGWFSSPWSKAFVPLLGQQVSLDDIEHEMLRAPGRYDDPRIHFAVNCASIGCPPLREEAFVGERLDEQLDEQVVRFLSDRSRNYYDPESGTLRVSKIFDWYREDFSKGYRGIDSLKDFFARYGDVLAEPPHSRAIKAGAIDIGFLPYDWALNDVR